MTFQLGAYILRKGTDHITRGPNVKRNHINIACPFCGDDPSHHMGVNLQTGKWGCWRSTLHRGNHPFRLLNALYGLTWDQVKDLVKGGVEPPGSLGELEALLTGLGSPTNAPKGITRLMYPDTFRSFPTDPNHPMEQRVRRYLAERGYAEYLDDPRFIERYQMQYESVGRFAYRAILPVFGPEGLLGWTGRAIGPAELKYVSYPSGAQLAGLLYNELNALEGSNEYTDLILVEGPFDAIKFDWAALLGNLPVTAVALMGLAITPEKARRLYRLFDCYRRVWLCSDNDLPEEVFSLVQKLPTAQLRITSVPEQFKDPGEMPIDEATKYLLHLTRQ